MNFVSIMLCGDYISVIAESRGSKIYKDGRFHKSVCRNTYNKRRIKTAKQLIKICSVFISVIVLLSNKEKTLQPLKALIKYNKKTLPESDSVYRG